MIYQGSCHCGALRYEVDGPEALVVQECNCSICSRAGYLHYIVPAARFRLVQGEDALTCYTFDSAEAKHLFCKHCGIKSYYVPRSNPDGFSVNVRCLQPQPENIIIEQFDGQNWEQHAHELAHLSHDD